MERQKKAIVISDSDSSEDEPSMTLGSRLLANTDFVDTLRHLGGNQYSHLKHSDYSGKSESSTSLNRTVSTFVPSAASSTSASSALGHQLEYLDEYNSNVNHPPATTQDALDTENSASYTSREQLSPPVKRKKRTHEDVLNAKRLAEEKKRIKEEERERKKLEREEKAKAKELETNKKRFEREQKKAQRPGECLKHLMVMLDPALVRNTCGARILAVITEREQRYEIQPQPHPNLISFWREVALGIETPANQFEVVKKEEVQDQVLLWLPVDQFVTLVHGQKQMLEERTLSLRSFIQGLQRKLEGRNVTVIVQGLQKYYRDQKVAKARKKTQPVTSIVVSRLDVEEVLVDIQFTTLCNIRFTETDDETARMVMQYTKAVAEAPFKKDRCNSKFNVYIDTAKCVRIDADGAGITRAWRQIIQIFRGVGADVANAIMAEYPTPCALYEAYKKCVTEKEGIQVLENIMVRRGYGVMETSRRVGKELAKKMYVLFTSTDPEVMLR